MTDIPNCIFKTSSIIILLLAANISLAHALTETDLKNFVSKPAVPGFFSINNIFFRDTTNFNSHTINRDLKTHTSINKKTLPKDSIANSTQHFTYFAQSVLQEYNLPLYDIKGELANALSELLIKSSEVVTKNFPRLEEWILLLAGLGLVCLQISKKNLEEQSSYLRLI